MIEICTHSSAVKSGQNQKLYGQRDNLYCKKCRSLVTVFVPVLEEEW